MQKLMLLQQCSGETSDASLVAMSYSATCAAICMQPEAATVHHAKALR